MFKVNNEDTKTSAFLINFELILHLVLVLLLLTLNITHHVHKISSSLKTTNLSFQILPHLK